MEDVRKIEVSVTKVDAEHGLVFGFAVICKVDGQDYYDQGSVGADGNVYSDHIPEDEMLSMVTDFMKAERVAKEMHAGEQRGMIVHSFPLTTEIAKALDITTKRTGWIIAMAPDPDMLAKFKSGELTGFSVGGTATRDVEEAA